ncbi:MAG TPA: hypothetical protein VKF63_12170, partial [Terracidiphilus sp.]|nr:hypothetical protein [Terracidiphilus sp.]
IRLTLVYIPFKCTGTSAGNNCELRRSSLGPFAETRLARLRPIYEIWVGVPIGRSRAEVASTSVQLSAINTGYASAADEIDINNRIRKSSRAYSEAERCHH